MRRRVGGYPPRSRSGCAEPTLCVKVNACVADWTTSERPCPTSREVGRRESARHAPSLACLPKHVTLRGVARHHLFIHLPFSPRFIASASSTFASLRTHILLQTTPFFTSLLSLQTTQLRAHIVPLFIPLSSAVHTSPSSPVLFTGTAQSLPGNLTFFVRTTSLHTLSFSTAARASTSFVSPLLLFIRPWRPSRFLSSLMSPKRLRALGVWAPSLVIALGAAPRLVGSKSPVHTRFWGWTRRPLSWK